VKRLRAGQGIWKAATGGSKMGILQELKENRPIWFTKFEA